MGVTQLRIYLKGSAPVTVDSGKTYYKGQEVFGEKELRFLMLFHFNPYDVAIGNFGAFVRASKEDIECLNLQYKEEWLRGRFQTDGEQYTHEDALCTVDAYELTSGGVKTGNGAVLNVSAKSFDSILVLMKKLKDGDLKSHQEIRKELEIAKIDLASEKLDNRDLLELQAQTMKTVTNLSRQIVWLRKPFWKRWAKRFQVWYLNRWVKLPVGERDVYTYVG